MLRYFWLLLFFVYSSSTFAKTAADAEKDSGDKEVLAVLADVLEDTEQRQQLINQLRNISGSNDNFKIVTDVKSEAENTIKTETSNIETEAAITKITENTRQVISQAASLPRRFAASTAEIASQMGERIQRSLQGMAYIFSGKDYRLSNINWSLFRHSLHNLGIVIAGTVLLYQCLRYLSHPIRRRWNNWSLRGDWSKPLVRKLVTIVAVGFTDSVFVALAYVAGSALALYAVGETGQLSTQASLFMNAFIIIELLKIGVRVVFLPKYTGIRLLDSDEATNRYWYHWIATIINLLGYGYLVALPLIEAYLSYTLAQTVSTAIALIAFVYGVWVVIAKRKGVHDALLRVSSRADFKITKISLHILAAIWHWLALSYFTMLLVVTLLRAERSLPFVLKGTLNTLLTVGIGMLISGLLTEFMGRRIKLPNSWKLTMPNIEGQINGYIPLLLRILRFILFLSVFFIVMSAWGVMDLKIWLNSSEGEVLVNKWLGVAIILFFSVLIWIVFCAIIEHRLSPNSGSGPPSPRVETLLSLLRNAFAIFLVTISIMMLLSQIGINIGPLIAGAGVLGLAVGFGAQTLIKDVITGIFIQIENAMNTGDFVTVDGISGTAERISIRSVSLRDINGTYHLIPFSSVTIVSNYMRGFSYHTEDYGISYNDDIDYACEVLKAAFDELVKGEHKRDILEPIAIQGVSSLHDSSVNIRVRIKTLPGEQWAVGRAYNRLVKLYFDQAGIEIPYPHQTLYFRKQDVENNKHIIQKERVRETFAKENIIRKPDNVEPPDVLKKQNIDDSTPDEYGDL